MSLTCHNGSCDDLRFQCTSTPSLRWKPPYSLYSSTGQSEQCNKWGVVGCCQWCYGETIACTNDECVITANVADSIINGTHVNTLSVYCLLYGDKQVPGCGRTQILCPIYGNCVVDCAVDNSCDNIEIISGTTSRSNFSLSLICNGYCHNMVIKAEYASWINIECNLTKCENITIFADLAGIIMCNERSICNDGYRWLSEYYH